MTIIEIEGRKVEVDDSFKNLSPEQQQKEVDEIGAAMGITEAARHNGVMGQVNAGIAETFGGLVDFVNPFDDPAWGKYRTGSAVDGLKAGMNAIGADVATQGPQGFAQGFGRGTGNAAGAVIPVAKGLQALRGAGGAVGAFADDALQALGSYTGLSAEVMAGGISGAAGETAEDMGAPEWAQTAAEVAAPLAVGGAIVKTPTALTGMGRLAETLPVTGHAIKAGKDVVKGFLPMTNAGARQIARARVHELVGGEDNAAALNKTIELNNELNLTPAQQSQDPRLLGLERQAALENPALSDRLFERQVQSRQTAQDEIDALSGDFGDATAFFDDQLKAFKGQMSDRVTQAMRIADDRLKAVGPRRGEAENSSAVVRQIKSELEDQLAVESDMWARVPQDAPVSTSQTKTVVDRLVDETPWSQRRDIPQDLTSAFGENGAIGDTTTVKELYGLYSEMRRVARSAMAGTDQNKNLARIANEVAEAALKDLGTDLPDSEIGLAFNKARAFSRSLHETFDRGAVGRILQRDTQGNEAIAPAAALRRTVGRSGPQGMVDALDIQKAARGTAEDIDDYLRGRFAEAATNASGEFTPKTARTWLRNHSDVLNVRPDLRKEFFLALSDKQSADLFRIRTEARVKLLESGSSVSTFGAGSADHAVLSVISSKDPAKTAASIVSTARKDKSGKALSGVKAAFTDYLIGKTMSGTGRMSGAKLKAVLSDKNLRGAMRKVFADDELARLNKIGRSLSKLDSERVTEVSTVLNSPSNQILEYVVRVAAARHGGQLGGGTMGGSLQTANIFTNKARGYLNNLTNNKARQMLMDAVEDPALFKLLLEPQSVQLKKQVRDRLAPYVAGTAAQGGGQED